MNTLRHRLGYVAFLASLIVSLVVVDSLLAQPRPGGERPGGPNPGGPNPGGPNPGVQDPGAFPGNMPNFNLKQWTCSKCNAVLAVSENEPTHITRCPSCGARLSSSSSRTMGYIIGGVVVVIFIIVGIVKKAMSR